MILTNLVPPEDHDFLQLELEYHFRRAAREFIREIKQHEPWARS